MIYIYIYILIYIYIYYIMECSIHPKLCRSGWEWGYYAGWVRDPQKKQDPFSQILKPPWNPGLVPDLFDLGPICFNVSRWSTKASNHVRQTHDDRFRASHTPWSNELPALGAQWSNYPVKVKLPSGKRSHNYGKSPFSMGKSTINVPFSIANC